MKVERRQLIPTAIVIPTAIAFVLFASGLHAQKLEMPRRHDRPPGPALSPEEAVAKMTVPEGFSVEIVAAEPDVVNPVAMFIDEKGRFWITESFEYPRKEPGPGRDRIKVLEDTDGDGQVDKVTIFAEGLNIPSGIAVGYGGVWVANSPDILFLQDTDGDLKADKTDVIVTGFGRTDTHELPNSLSWGPDGWLYGLNGVFNYCDVKYGESNPNYKPDQPGWKFTCALWRIHPRTHEFQIFAEGTSNPWGIAINDEGDFFLSACVIDHLWHLVETGYYIRQGGPYPPHTWPIRSIVDHKHQKAAYCGITWFDSDCYPEEYRKVLYMGNIHGGCINADIVERSGSTYKGKPYPGFPPKPNAWKDDMYGSIAKMGDEQAPKLADFLTANDSWFMPVVQTTGPDGCLYVLDWYDRYHCYQDANADPEGVDRGQGRLYRIAYQGHQNRKPTDLSALSNAELVDLLNGPNEYIRTTARRLLTERVQPESAEFASLFKRTLEESIPVDQRLRCLWTLCGIPNVPSGEPRQGFHERICMELLRSREPQLRAWAVRLLKDQRELSNEAEDAVAAMASDPSPLVQLQVVVAAGKLKQVDPLPLLLTVLTSCGDDPIIPQIVWQNLHPLLTTRSADFLKLAKSYDLQQTPNLANLMPRILECVLAGE
ncbi:MAG: PVC-type heme-binding CxxCH protein [Planctomycetaceae bacterium]